MKSSSVKKIVITSSIAVLDIEKSGTISGKPSLAIQTRKLISNPAHDLGPILPLDKLSSPFTGYIASKRIALQKTIQFIEEKKPRFSVIHVLPSVIIGRNELVTTASDFSSGTNRYVINIAKGLDAPAPLLGASVYVNDCADIHLLALDDKINGNQNFIASAGAVVWNDVSEIIRHDFGEKVKDHSLKLEGNLDTKALDLDPSDTDRAFGVKWTAFNAQVKSVVEHYLEIVTERH